MILMRHKVQCKEQLTQEIKATITGSSMNTDFVVIPGGFRWHGEQTIQKSPKAVHCKWFLTGDHALTPAERIKKPSVTLSVDHHGMAAHLM
jgi:hypothetical protein